MTMRLIEANAKSCFVLDSADKCISAVGLNCSINHWLYFFVSGFRNQLANIVTGFHNFSVDSAVIFSFCHKIPKALFNCFKVYPIFHQLIFFKLANFPASERPI